MTIGSAGGLTAVRCAAGRFVCCRAEAFAPSSRSNHPTMAIAVTPATTAVLGRTAAATCHLMRGRTARPLRREGTAGLYQSTFMHATPLVCMCNGPVTHEVADRAG